MTKAIIFPLLLSVAVASAGDLKITADKTNGCVPLAVTFSAPSNELNATWSWDFGNGNTSNQKTPSVVFMKAGVYEVNVFVNSAKGIESSGIIITVNEAPKADFNISKTKACAGEVLEFTNLSSAGLRLTKYVWAFDDGKTAIESNVTHSYSAAGNYSVTLVVTDANGCGADKTSYSSVTINPVPTVGFKPSVNGSCSETQRVAFANESKGSGIKYSWSFGDGKTSGEESPSHLFTQGKFDVTLNATDVNGCSASTVKKVSVTNLHVDFSASNETPSADETIKFFSTSNFKGTKWMWDFGDGTVSNLHSPEKTYSKPGTYSVKFTLTDETCSESLTKSSFIKVIKGNPVTFTSDFSSSCAAPVTVKFKNTTPNAAITLWEFGDGTVSTKPNPEKVFNSPGNYKVTLSVTDSSGYTIKKGIDNYITAAKPMVRFGGDTFGCIGYPVKFYNFTPNATTYLWSFGDGETSTQKNPAHVYKSNGNYTVSLTAQNGERCDSTVTMKNYVHVGELKVDFEMVSTKSAIPPFVCSFTNKSQTGNIKYIWDFGDGSSEIEPNPVHVYTVPGTFNVRLLAFTKSGCSGTKTVENTFEMGTSLNEPVILSGSN